MLRPRTQAAHLEDAMLRRLSKRRQMRLEADIRLLDKRLAEMVAADKKSKVIIVAVMRKMITTLNAMLRDSAAWQPRSA